ncbi:MAG: hypothetical protein IIY78_06340 [Clostridia bacterium]|nr:hypothetical protein [Clostridia bacterium]
MNLYINSPSYYKNVYGVDDEIYWMCREISDYVKNTEYSVIVDTIGISPIVAPREEIENGNWKEETRYAIKSKLIIVSRHIDYEKYVNASISEKKKLIVGNILRSIKSVKGKGKIDYSQFEEDLLSLLGYTKDEIAPYISV